MSIEAAIQQLQETPVEQSEARDNALVSSMIAIIDGHEQPFGLIISLAISYLMVQPDRNRSLIHFTNALTAAWIGFEQYQAEIEKAMIESREIGLMN